MSFKPVSTGIYHFVVVLSLNEKPDHEQVVLT